MDESLRQQFYAELKRYLSEGNLNVDGVANSFGEMILNYVEADPASLTQALHQINIEKTRGFSTKKDKAYAEVRLPHSNIFVTCYFSGEMPLLRFYNGNRKNLIFKIDKERQKNGGVLFSALYEKGNQLSENSEKNSERYSLSSRRTSYEKKHSLTVFDDTAPTVFDKNSIQEEDKRVFYEIINLLFKNSAINLDGKMSNESADIILNKFYENARQILSFPQELGVNEVLRAAIEMFYSSELSSISEQMENYDEFITNDGSKLDLRVDGHNLNMQNMSPDVDYFDIEAFNQDNQVTTKYIIFKTKEGFTIHRKYVGDMSGFDKRFTSYALGISKNMMKISMLGNEFYKNPLEITLRFNKSGLEYVENESLFFGDAGSFDKRPSLAVLGE